MDPLVKTLLHSAISGQKLHWAPLKSSIQRNGASNSFIVSVYCSLNHLFSFCARTNTHTQRYQYICDNLILPMISPSPCIDRTLLKDWVLLKWMFRYIRKAAQFLAYSKHGENVLSLTERESEEYTGDLPEFLKVIKKNRYIVKEQIKWAANTFFKKWQLWAVCFQILYLYLTSDWHFKTCLKEEWVYSGGKEW